MAMTTTTKPDVKSPIDEALENPSELETFAINAIRVGMVFGPSIGYFAQMREIRVTHNCEGFSPLLSLILLASNTLRIYYWIGARFNIALLCQAIVMIAVQSGLVYVVLRAQMSAAVNAAAAAPHGNTSAGTKDPNTSSNSIATDVDGGGYDGYAGVPRNPRQLLNQAISGPKGFVDALIFSPFPTAFKTMTPALFFAKLATMAIIFGLASGLVYAIGGTDYAEVIGYTALGLEGCLYLPQIHLNFVRRSTEGLTWVLLCTWVFGDVAKLLYFIFDNQPFPFIVCSCFQLTCDAVMLFEVFWFRKNKVGRTDIAAVMENGGPLPLPNAVPSSEMSTLRVAGSGVPNISGSSSTNDADNGPSAGHLGHLSGSGSSRGDVIAPRGVYGGRD